MGSVNNANDAIKAAKEVWTELYSDVSDEKPYKVYYDGKNNAWLVTGILPKYMVGGVANIIISEDNDKVLAAWHEK